MSPAWHHFVEMYETPSPALVTYRDRVRANIARAIELAGGVDRLRPHVKTHKMPAVVELCLAAGLRRFKCATLAEAEMTARCGAAEVLVGFPLAGPNVDLALRLVQAFPGTSFAALADDADSIGALGRRAAAAGVSCELLLDLDAGMERTGVAPGPAARELYRRLADTSGVTPGGLHVYDGHVRDADPLARARAADEAFQNVARLADELRGLGLPLPRIVAGGSPTFLAHARRAGVECSPGTFVFWDAGYGDRYPELGFQPAALVMGRVVSRPGRDRLTLDLGTKAVAADMPPPRLQLLEIPAARTVWHNEELLTVETELAEQFPVGREVFGLPVHICPTCALYREALAVEGGRIVERWPVAGRDRALTV